MPVLRQNLSPNPNQGGGGACLYCGSFHIFGMSASCCARLIALAMRFCFFSCTPVSLRGRMVPLSLTWAKG